MSPSPRLALPLAEMRATSSTSFSVDSFTVGIGLNRIADFNSRYSYKTDTPYAGGSVWAPTIADIITTTGHESGSNTVSVTRPV